jgi:hypothetical protein
VHLFANPSFVNLLTHEHIHDFWDDYDEDGVAYEDYDDYKEYKKEMDY